jgi:membrane complex biogenesis BtpA family protein
MLGLEPLGNKKLIIGMVHLGPMPGTPFYKKGSYEGVFEKALQDAKNLHDGGAHGCLAQTVDGVYPTEDHSDPARVVGVANIVRAIVQETDPDFLVGVQIMRNAITASLAVAKICGGSFVRCGVFVGATITGDGIVNANPHAVQTYRAHIDAMDIALIAEIDSMHFKWMGGQSTASVAVSAQYARADALSLGDPDPEITLGKIREVRKSTPQLPIMLCGYTNRKNAKRLLSEADGAFVGTAFEKGEWGGSIDVNAVRNFMEIVTSI